MSEGRDIERHEERGRRGLLTLDVNGDAGLLAVGDCLVGGFAGDLLTRLDVGRREVERAHGAFSPAVPQQGLQRGRQS